MRKVYILGMILFFSLAANSQSRILAESSTQNRAIKFYPNPAISYIVFEFQHSYEKNLNLQVINFLGRKVFEQNNISSKTTLNLNDFYRGVYIFQLRDPNGKVVESGKFQVSK